MKNINSKSFKQYQASSNKRSASPLLNTQQGLNPTGIQSTSQQKSSKKKVGNSPYQKTKQFETYGKNQRKKTTTYLEKQPAEHNKFRIVTQPVDDRILHLAQSGIFNNPLGKYPRKIEAEILHPNTQIRLNLRTNNSQSKSRERIYSKNTDIRGQRESVQIKNRTKELSIHSTTGITTNKCKNCLKYGEELEYLNIQIKKILSAKELWKAGEATLQQIQKLYHCVDSSNTVELKIKKQQDKQRMSEGNTSTHNSLQNLGKWEKGDKNRSNLFKFADSIANQIKNSFLDFIGQVQSLSSIDYPKMLQMQILTYEPTYSDSVDAQELQLQDLFGQLKKTMEGKIGQFDLQQVDSESNYLKMVLANMKSRLSFYLRQNLELKICKAIYEKSQEISDESEQYLRKVIEQVLDSYIKSPKNKGKNKERPNSGKKL